MAEAGTLPGRHQVGSPHTQISEEESSPGSPVLWLLDMNLRHTTWAQVALYVTTMR